MLAGAYPSDEFAELKPRAHLGSRRRASSRAAGTRGSWRSRAAARSRTAACTACSSSARPGTGRAGGVGELDEEMVYESRVGEVITLGASSWRIERDPPRSGDGHAGARRARQAAVLARRCGRAADRARAGARRVRAARSEGDLGTGAEAGSAASRGSASDTTSTRSRPRTWSRTSRTSRTATGALPTDRRIVVERFRDELGDWRICLLTPFGGARPRAVVARARGAARRAARAPRSRRSGPTTASRSGCRKASSANVDDLLFPDPDEIEDLVVGAGGELGAVRGALPRERGARAAAAAAPARDRGRRCGSSASARPDLLAVASRYGSFPILVETYRECLSDVFDLPALRELLGGVARREIAVHGVETVRARRPSRARCSSTTSPPTCTTATRRWPSGAPRR